MVMNVDDPDIREVKVEDDSECSSNKLDERSDLNFQPEFQSPLKGFTAERLLILLLEKMCQQTNFARVFYELYASTQHLL